MKGIGLVALSTDPVGEDAFKAIMWGTPVRVFTTRTGYDGKSMKRAALFHDQIGQFF